MKKLLLFFGALLVLIFVALVTIPILFKDDIQAAIDQAMDENLNAEVYYDVDKFSLSLIRNFPDFTVSIGNFGIAGVDIFVGDTLVAVDNFQITVDLMSAISGDQIKINEVILDEPRITILVTEDGRANYDIAVATEETEEAVPEESTGSSDISIGVDRWSINNGQLIYLDQSMHFYTTVLGLNHEGSGDFTLDVFDLSSLTTVESFSLGYEGEEYISDKEISADVSLNMDLSAMKFTFLDNRVAVNEFAIQADGFLEMPSEDIVMDITFGGKEISLKSILSLIPGSYQEYLDGVEAAGAISFEGFVKGTFNETSMPQVAANLSIDDGSIKYAEYPIPMEEINVKTSFSYPSADLSETSFNVDQFHMLVDGEELSAYLKFKDLENYTWDFGFDGNLDLEKVTKIVPLEGMELKGKINAKLNSAGQMSDVEAEKYDQLPTSGSMSIAGFSFSSEDFTQGFGIEQANLAFNPSEITLSSFQANAGKSDMNLKGKVSNYLAFALNDELLTGTLDFQSNLLDLNEWMPEETEEVEEEETADTTSLEVVRIPQNIDFTLASNIKKIAITNLSIDDFQGKLLIRDGAIVLDDNSFKMLDGTFALKGSYRTKEEKPTYDFGFDIKDLGIANAFNSFETIQKLVPVAEQVTGRFSTNFTVDGTIGEDMMPILDEMNLAGLVNIAQATLNSGSFLTNVSALTSLKSGNNASSEEKSISLKDVLVSAEIKNGRLFIEPFDLDVNGQQATLGGSNSLDGQLDYAMLVKDVPTGQIGNALNSALSSFTGGKKLIDDKINLNLGIGGTYEDPQVKLLGTSKASSSSSGGQSNFKSQLTSQVDDQKAKAEEELAKKKAEAEAKLAAEKAKAQEEAEAKKKAAEEEAKRKLEEEKKKAEEAAKKKLNSLFKKKKGG